ncbi:MAG: glycosyltransferase [Pirellulaceae bacterium]|nr:glycosyltransferase [Pirellulaceae bacterium]
MSRFVPLPLLYFLPASASPQGVGVLAQLLRALPRNRWSPVVFSLASKEANAILEKEAPLCTLGQKSSIDTFSSSRRRFSLSPLFIYQKRLRELAPAIVHNWETTPDFTMLPYLWAGKRHQQQKGMHFVYSRPYLNNKASWIEKKLGEALLPLPTELPPPAGEPSGLLEKSSPEYGRLKKELTDELGLPTDAYLAVAGGPLVASRKLKDLIWMVDLLEAFYEKFHLVIFGNGPQKWRLDHFRRQVHVADRVHFVDNPFLLQKYLPVSSAYLVSDEKEPLNSWLLTAMACKVPVIAAKSSELEKQFQVDDNILFFTPADRAGIARQLWPLLENPDFAEPLVENAKNLVEQKYTLDLMRSKYTELYSRF